MRCRGVFLAFDVPLVYMCTDVTSDYLLLMDDCTDTSSHCGLCPPLEAFILHCSPSSTVYIQYPSMEGYSSLELGGTVYLFYRLCFPALGNVIKQGHPLIWLNGGGIMSL